MYLAPLYFRLPPKRVLPNHRALAFHHNNNSRHPRWQSRIMTLFPHFPPLTLPQDHQHLQISRFPYLNWPPNRHKLLRTLLLHYLPQLFSSLHRFLLVVNFRHPLPLHHCSTLRLTALLTPSHPRQPVKRRMEVRWKTTGNSALRCQMTAIYLFRTTSLFQILRSR